MCGQGGLGLFWYFNFFISLVLSLGDIIGFGLNLNVFMGILLNMRPIKP